MATPSLQLPDVETMPAEDVLRWAYEEFGDRLCLTCSWQKQSSVLVHMVSELGLDIAGRRARHAALLPRELRDARPARRALRAEPAPAAAGDHRRRAAPRRGPEPLGDATPTAAATSARSSRCCSALEPYDAWISGHPPRPVAEPRRARRRSQWSERYERLEAAPARRLGREARLGLHHGQRDSLQPAARRRASARSAASRAPGRRRPRKRSAPAAGPAPTSSSAGSTSKRH